MRSLAEPATVAAWLAVWCNVDELDPRGLRIATRPVTKRSEARDQRAAAISPCEPSQRHRELVARTPQLSECRPSPRRRVRIRRDGPCVCPHPSRAKCAAPIPLAGFQVRLGRTAAVRAPHSAARGGFPALDAVWAARRANGPATTLSRWPRAALRLPCGVLARAGARRRLWPFPASVTPYRLSAREKLSEQIDESMSVATASQDGLLAPWADMESIIAAADRAGTTELLPHLLERDSPGRTCLHPVLNRVGALARHRTVGCRSPLSVTPPMSSPANHAGPCRLLVLTPRAGGP